MGGVGWVGGCEIWGLTVQQRGTHEKKTKESGKREREEERKDE